MKNYPREERIDMVFTLGECHKNCLLASQLCQELYGNDFENRTEFCMWMLDKVAENEKFFEH
ncbi:hypothetical protein D910_01046, partial [Dendroctonus ponderosae]